MTKTIKSMDNKYLQTSLDMVRRTFTNSETAEDAQIVVNIIEEIRTMSSYVPELEIVMVNDDYEVIGYVMFSKLFLDGKMQDELLVLNPVAVKTELQRQHISKELIEAGFEKAKELGFKAVIVEGNPMNYRNRGFKTSADFGIVAAQDVGLPAPECLMVKELVDGALDNISGKYSYADYETLK
ncbi:MAG: N-acetyltransferase [Ruminococcus sp.]|nr:N-acetyltransferase [Ruminococcus sp.]